MGQQALTTLAEVKEEDVQAETDLRCGVWVRQVLRFIHSQPNGKVQHASPTTRHNVGQQRGNCGPDATIVAAISRWLLSGSGSCDVPFIQK